MLLAPGPTRWVLPVETDLKNFQKQRNFLRSVRVLDYTTDVMGDADNE